VATRGALAVTHRSLGPDGSIVRAVSVRERIQVSPDLDEQSAEEELRHALTGQGDGVSSIRVQTKEVTRRRQDRDPKVPALDIPVIEQVLEVAIVAVKSHALDAVSGAVASELLDRAIAAVKGRRDSTRREPFPAGSVFEVAPEVLRRASEMLNLPPGSLVPESAVGNTERVDIHARLIEQDGGSRFYHAWGTRDGELGIERMSSSDWRRLFDR
jgi:hypothetical protein